MAAFARRHAESLSALALLLALALLAHAPLIGQLGFYRDDWYMLWAGRLYGPSGVVTLFSIDRPVMGYTYALTYSLLGDSPLPWHVYALALRLGGALAALWLMRQLWPGARAASAAAAALMVVYPGFLQQPNGNTLSNQLFGYACGLLSIALTARALRAARPAARAGLTLAAALTGLLCMLIYEYMIGLELLRLMVIVVLSARAAPARPRRAVAVAAARAWLPYAAVIAGQLVWRIFLFESERPGMNVGRVFGRFLEEPLLNLARLPSGLALDLLETAVFAWAVPAYNGLVALRLRDLLFAGALGLAAAAALWLYLRARRAEPSHAGDAASWLLIGGLTALGALAPVLAAGRDVHFHSGFDRYTLHATLGVALLTVGFLWRFVAPAGRTAVLALLIGVAAASNFANARQWADFWAQQRQIWWQLSWRAPQLAPGTVLMARVPASEFFEDYEVWGPANLIYNPTAGPIRVGAQILTEDTAWNLRFGVRDGRGMRVLIRFERDYSQALLLDLPSPATCLHVLDSVRPEAGPDTSSLMLSLVRYSQTDRIQTEAWPAQVPAEILGPEPEHGWCYYFQSASLERQRGDWQEVARLADEARARELRPAERSEWMPMLQGYVALGRLDDARELAARIRDREEVRHALCDSLRLTPPDLSPSATADLMRLLCE